MDKYLAGAQWSECLVYLDEMGKNFDDHLHNVLGKLV